MDISTNSKVRWFSPSLGRLSVFRHLWLPGFFFPSVSEHFQCKIFRYIHLSFFLLTSIYLFKYFQLGKKKRTKEKNNLVLVEMKHSICCCVFCQLSIRCCRLAIAFFLSFLFQLSNNFLILFICSFLFVLKSVGIDEAK